MPHVVKGGGELLARAVVTENVAYRTSLGHVSVHVLYDVVNHAFHQLLFAAVMIEREAHEGAASLRGLAMVRVDALSPLRLAHPEWLSQP